MPISKLYPTSSNYSPKHESSESFEFVRTGQNVLTLLKTCFGSHNVKVQVQGDTHTHHCWRVNKMCPSPWIMNVSHTYSPLLYTIHLAAGKVVNNENVCINIYTFFLSTPTTTELNNQKAERERCQHMETWVLGWTEYPVKVYFSTSMRYIRGRWLRFIQLHIHPFSTYMGSKLGGKEP